MNYARFYVGDYLRDTARLSMIEHGAYLLMLSHYYAEELPLPVDKDEIYTVVRAMTPADRKAVDKVLDRYFTLEADGYHNARADKEIATSKQARNNGGSGGRPPKKETGTQTGTITGTVTGSETGTITGTVTGSETGTITGTVTGSETGTITGTVTENVGEDGGGSGHPPTTNHQPPATSRQPPEKAGRGSRLNLDSLPPEWRDFCIAERTDLDPEKTFASFADHWKSVAGSKGVKLDWPATWRNWVRAQWAQKGTEKRPEIRVDA